MSPRPSVHNADIARAFDEIADLKGDLHAHTVASDGRATIREMALAAKARGLGYLAITDHSRRLAMAHGLDATRLARQAREIDALNSTLRGIVLLRGIEVDILPDCCLDLSRSLQTERILAAMEPALRTRRTTRTTEAG
jgi:histidinol phosphatase-like PHP family hydrolase